MCVWIPLILLETENNKKYISVIVYPQNHCLLACLHCLCPVNSAIDAGLKKKKKDGKRRHVPQKRNPNIALI